MFRYTKGTLAVEIVTIIAAVVMLLPFWILIVTAFKTGDQVLKSSAFAPPAQPTIGNFVTLLSPASSASGNIFVGLAVSIVITAGTILCLIVFGSLAAYVLSRSTRKWSNRTYYLFLIPILLPTHRGTLPLYIGARNLGLVGSPFGMILIYTGQLLPLA